jgi:hypothetical protein
MPSGTCYHQETPIPPGKSWLDEHGTEGRIGRSTGTVKIPLLVPPRHDGGPGLFDHCIVRLQVRRKPHTVLWQHPNFHVPEITYGYDESNPLLPPHVLYAGGEEHSRHKTKDGAHRLMAWLQGA